MNRPSTSPLYLCPLHVKTCPDTHVTMQGKHEQALQILRETMELLENRHSSSDKNNNSSGNMNPPNALTRGLRYDILPVYTYALLRSGDERAAEKYATEGLASR